MKLEPISYNGGVIWVDINYKDKCDYMMGLTVDQENSKWILITPENRKDYVGSGVFGIIYKVVAQSPNLSIPNIPYVEVEEDDIKCPFCQGKMEAQKEDSGKRFYLTCVSEDDNCPAKGMMCDGEFGTAMVTLPTAKQVEDDAKKRLAASAKKWSDEDMRKAIHFGEMYQRDNIKPLFEKKGKLPSQAVDDFIQSLQPKIKSIEIEMEEKEFGHVDDYSQPHGFELEPITYQKYGKTFLKVKSVSYDTVN